MITRRKFLKNGSLGVAAVAAARAERALGAPLLNATAGGTAPATMYKYENSKRPAPAERNFTSKAVEEAIRKVTAQIKDEKLALMFENCFPNTLDTTVHYRLQDGKPDTFVYTGDIHAMWLRDSAAQVWPYLSLMKGDEPLQLLIAGVVNRQTKCVLFDPYANAFNDGPTGSEWKTDMTDMKPELHERKWEIDSLCYTVRLAYNYWKLSGDTSVFDSNWQRAAALIVKTFKEQQRKDGVGPYRFQRKTERQLDTLCNSGYGAPTKPVGLIVSSFRPSDDATTYGFLVPSNLFAVTSLKQLAEISEKVTNQKQFAKECTDLAAEVQKALNQYAVAEHLRYGKIYAFEVDGFGNRLFMDDSNVPSLLALPYLGSVDINDRLYQNTRRFVWSADNPYFFKGKAAEGVGGPHIGYDMVWPMSLTVRALTSQNDEEIKYCVRTLRDTDAGTGFMHEAFHKDDPTNFTRSWFAWANTLFGELLLKLVNEGKVSLLNSL
jgi:meiotically up-regulated gene 157 (Mug157) protein